MKPNIPQMFDAISPSYDRINRILSFGLDLRWRRLLAKHLPLGTCFDLLDLATGTGDQIAAFFKMNAPIKRAVGIDFSKKMLEIARAKFRNINQVTFLEADAEALPFEDQSFDVCSFSFGIRNVQNPLIALSELRRVTKPRGRCLILEFSMPTGFFRFPYRLYSRTLLPTLGGFLSGNRAAYHYLNQSIEQFAQPETFLSWMRQTGWINTKAISNLFGAVTLYRGDVAS